MATDKSAIPGIQLPWAGKQVLPEQVEDELTALWHLAADNMRISQNMNVRTSVLNFVICVPDVESAHQVNTLLRDLSSTHIARVILLILDMRSERPTDVTSWVTLRSFSIVSDVMRHHYEQVTLMVSGTAVKGSANIVLSVLKPDLPVYLWWLHELPSDQVILERLISISDRVIVDSTYFSHPEQQVRDLSTILQGIPNSALSDLAWARVTPWRELIAQFFDVADYRPYLLNVNQIEIEHAVIPSSEGEVSSNSIQALLMAAWLKTRLGWKLSYDRSQNVHDSFKGIHSWRMTQRAATQTRPLNVIESTSKTDSITITLQPRVQTELTSGALCLVRLHSMINGHEATFSINRESNDEHVLTSVDIPGTVLPQRTVNIAATHKDGALLHDELEIMGRDHLYEDTLHEVFALLA